MDMAQFTRKESESKEQFRSRIREFLNARQGEVFVASLSDMFGGSKKICDRYGVPEAFASFQALSGEERQLREDFEQAQPILDQLMKNVVAEYGKAWDGYGNWAFEQYGHHNLATLPVKSSVHREQMRTKSLEKGGFLTILVPHVELKPAEKSALPEGIDLVPKLEMYPWVPVPMVSHPDSPYVPTKIVKKFEKGFTHIAKVAKHVLSMIKGDSPTIVVLPEGETQFCYNNNRPYHITRAEYNFWRERFDEDSFKIAMCDIYNAAATWCVVPNEILLGRPVEGFEDEVAKALAAKRTADLVERAGGNQRNHSIQQGVELVSRDGLPDTCMTVKAGQHIFGRDGERLVVPAPAPRETAAKKQQNAANDSVAATATSSGAAGGNYNYLFLVYIIILSFRLQATTKLSLIPQHQNERSQVASLRSLLLLLHRCPNWIREWLRSSRA